MDLDILTKPSKQRSIRSFFQPRTIPPSPSAPIKRQLKPEKEPEKEPDKGEGTVREEEYHPTPSTITLQADDIGRVELSRPDLPRASISAIEAHHIRPLKRINTLLLPISYPDNFYNGILSPEIPWDLSYVILWNSPKPSSPTSSKVYTIQKEQQVVGGIVCRLEQSLDRSTTSVYIQSLGLLSPYRSQGLATALLDAVINAVVQLPASFSPSPSSIYAHVWTENSEALAWYKARGFNSDWAPIENYYSRLRPGTAFLLRRPIDPSDYLRHNSNTTTTASNRSSDDWEMVESPNMISKSTSAPATLPFVAPPPKPAEPAPKTSKKTSPPAQTYLNFPPAPTPPAPAPNTTSNRNLPSSKPNQPRPDTPTQTQSFQNRAPDQEWNDLPLDILNASNKNSLSRTSSLQEGSGIGANAASSKGNSSASRPPGGKKKRSYPAAAFGGS